MKLLGPYPESISRRLYEATPKAVFAGIAAGVALNGGASVQIADADTPNNYIMREWVLMFEQGHVKSQPPSWVRAAVKRERAGEVPA